MRENTQNGSPDAVKRSNGKGIARYSIELVLGWNVQMAFATGTTLVHLSEGPVEGPGERKYFARPALRAPSSSAVHLECCVRSTLRIFPGRDTLAMDLGGTWADGCCSRSSGS
jgi:hypothetical protein